jgi:hypothetical protein
MIITKVTIEWNAGKKKTIFSWFISIVNLLNISIF